MPVAALQHWPHTFFRTVSHREGVVAMDALSSSDVYLFGPFRFDRRGGVLFRCNDEHQDLPISIGSRALAVLGALVDRPGDLVSKDEIMRAVWPGTVVE